MSEKKEKISLHFTIRKDLALKFKNYAKSHFHKFSNLFEKMISELPENHNSDEYINGDKK